MVFLRNNTVPAATDVNVIPRLTSTAGKKSDGSIAPDSSPPAESRYVGKYSAAFGMTANR